MVQTTQGSIGGPPAGGRNAPGLAFPGIKSAGGNVKGCQTVPGSYLTPSGGTGDGLGGRRTVPTASGRATRNPRGRKGVKTRTSRYGRALYAHYTCTEFVWLDA